MNNSKPIGATLVVLVVTAVWTAASQAQLADPIPGPISKGSVRVRLETIADGLIAPNLLTHAGDGSGRLFVVDQAGQVRLIAGGSLQAQPYLDASSLLVPLGAFGPGSFDERGLLGLAFHPDFENVGQPGYGKFYTYTSEPVGPAADFTVTLPAGDSFNNQSVVREWSVDPSSNVITGDPSSISRVLLRVDEPQFNHNAGMVAFGPDGKMYISFGDGGQGNDEAPGHTDGTGNGQDPSNVLGTILRIDPLGTSSANGQYGIPTDNPFFGSPTTVNEIFAYGLRNPFRYNFDVDPATGQVTGEATGRLIVADVGQGNIEEVDVVEAGDNLGWRLKEGSFYFNYKTTEVDDAPWADPDIVIPPGFNPVDPVLEYDHDEGISIIGGHVYRGSALPELAGLYVFGDFSQGFATPAGRLFFGDLGTGQIKEFILGTGDDPLGLFVKGFGQDPDGELYVLAGTNLAPFPGAGGQGLGVVLKIVPIPEPSAAALALLATVGGLVVGRPPREKVSGTFSSGR